MAATATPMIGASGIVAGTNGVTVLDTEEGRLLPCALLAITVQLTPTPLVRPVTVNGELLPLAFCPPQVAVKPVMEEPPVLDGAEKAIVTCALPATAVPMVGGSGMPSGATLADGLDGELVPAELVAVTVQDTGTPLGRLDTNNGFDNPLALCVPQTAVYDVIVAPPLFAGGV